MSVSKTGVVLFTLMFYIVLSYFIGESASDIQSMNTYTPQEQDSLSLSESNLSRNKTGFLRNVIIGYSNIPLWLNILIFTPLGSVFTWILVTTFIPTVDGGS